MADDYQLGGKVALVTGGARRIGRAIAERLAAGGASVLVNAFTSAELAEEVARGIEARGGRAVAHVADITDADAVSRMVENAVETFGRLDIVVHNAVARQHGDLAEQSLEAWHRALAVVLDGAFLCAKFAMPHLENARGTFIVIGGGSAFQGGGEPSGPTGKAGLVGFVRTLARNFGPKGVTANMLSPGTILAEGDDPKRVEFLTKARPLEQIPLRRHGTVDDVAEAVAMMCSPGMRYVTGQTIHLTGGFYMG